MNRQVKMHPIRTLFFLELQKETFFIEVTPIRKRMKAHGIKRDLGGKVRASVQDKLVSSLVSTLNVSETEIERGASV